MLKFSKTSEYALRILGHFAADEDRLYKSDDLFEELDIPFRYLRRLLSKLAKEGLLLSIQGKHGGFKLAKPKSEIALLDIVNAVDEKRPSSECFFGFESCPVNNNCSMHDKWMSVQDHINDVLLKTTLEELQSDDAEYFPKRLKNKL